MMRKYKFYFIIFSCFMCLSPKNIVVNATDCFRQEEKDPAPIRQRGDVISIEYLHELSKMNIEQILKNTKEASVDSYSTISDVLTYKVTYYTIGPFDELVTASGIFSFPKNCNANLSVVCHMHGTATSRYQVASNPSHSSSKIYPSFFSGLGNYYLVAPDYLGLGDSSILLHPYLQSDLLSTCARDLLTCVRKHVALKLKVTIGPDLYISGHSEGGLGAASLHQSLEEVADIFFEVKHSVPGAAPIDI